MKMKPATLLLNLSIFFMLTLTATSQNIFTCSSDSTCESLIDYVLPNSTTRLSQIAALFGVKSLFGMSDEANLLAGAVLDVPLRAYGPSNNADGPSNNVSKIGLQESRCWWLVISLSLSSLLSGLLMMHPIMLQAHRKNMSGEVIRWNNVSGPEKIDAVKYIEILEAEIEELNRQVGRKSFTGQNELLEYLKSLEPQNLKEMTSNAGEDVVVAMNTFIKRLLAVSDPAQMKTAATETSAAELAKLLYWLMVVGYSIRNIEVPFDMERVLGASPKLAELPPEENI